MDRRVSVIGLGYVGLPVAVAFAQHSPVVAFDISEKRITELQQGIDTTQETVPGDLDNTHLLFTQNPADLQRADFHIIAVATPVNDAKQPDLTALLSASATVGAQLKKGDIVVYESTVYPGATEEECLPILEKQSGLCAGTDFFIGYSPERINPADKEHTFTKIKKIVAAQTPTALDIVAHVYRSVITAGVHCVNSIRVAEAAKVIENTQRDINIAFVNELAMLFAEMDISIHEVLAAAETKWNFLPFQPGLVGGHCIGVDPYYLTYKAQTLGYHPEMILAGRRINDGMGKYIAEMTIKKMIAHNMTIRNAKVGILGFTFKANCPDVRNTKVNDVIEELKVFHTSPLVFDPQADPQDVAKEYGLTLQTLETILETDVIIIAVDHDEFFDADLQTKLNNKAIVIDIKNVLKASQV